MNNKIIILLGAPGSGKGTISDVLVEKYNFFHLSTGNIFRDEIKNNGPLKDKINFYLNDGKLVPDDITNELVKNKLTNLINLKKNIILDGYPRNINQAEILNTYCEISNVFYINVDEELVIKRIMGRMNCEKCNRNYNEFFLPPKINGICDDDGARLIKRKDDNIETIKNRLNTYNTLTLPLVNFYKNIGILHNINSDNDLDSNISQIESLLWK